MVKLTDLIDTLIVHRVVCIVPIIGDRLLPCTGRAVPEAARPECGIGQHIESDGRV